MFETKHFQTPHLVCHRMLDEVQGVPRSIMEPTPGAGHLVQAIRTRFPCAALTAVEGDFLAQDHAPVEYAIANPPFTPMKLGNQILERLLPLAEHIIILMPWLTLINGEKRTQLLRSWGLRKVIHLPRKAFPGARVQTCILVMDRGYLGPTYLEFAMW